jgi:hypothetical protein
MAAGDFLTIAGLAIPVQRTGAERAPDGPNGKRRWTFTTGPMAPAAVATLETAVGTGTGAESDRAWNGTLLTDRPLVTCTGLFADGASVLCEVRVDRAAFRHHRGTAMATEAAPSVRLVVSLVLRES